jgi:defect in organelle trafficking protein DotD
MRIKRFWLVIAIFLVTMGCASEEPNIRIVRNNGAKTAEAKLADAAVAVSRSLQELAKIEQAAHPHTKLPSPLDAEMIGMAQIASIDWSGPVGPLVNKIAAAANYKVHVLGTPPAIPILVSISAKDTPLADILRDAGFQCGEKANIVIYPSSKIIELRYAKV